MVVGQPPTSHEREVLYADVIVPRHLEGPFTYLVPSRLRPNLRIGHCVLVPFGRSLLQGAVVSLASSPPQGFEAAKLKEINSLLSDVGPTGLPIALFDLSKWVAEQYVAPWGQCLRLVLPPPVKPTRRTVRPRESADQPAVSDRHLLQADPHDGKFRSHATTVPGERLTVCRQELFQALHHAEASRILLHAPWAVRSTLLHHTVQAAHALGKTAVIVVGEAERAEEIARLIHEQETNAPLVCFHSGLPDHVRAEWWKAVDRQLVRIIVGTRSALFLPLHNVGMIWVEGEEGQALKEPQEPRYHARDVAWYRAQAEQALLVLSSAHPSLETRLAVESKGHVLHVPGSVDMAPAIQIVDLRGQGRESLLTPPLVQALREAVAERAGAILFLNRKFYAGALVCRDCGQIPRCPVCSVAFTYSRQRTCLLCAYCGTGAALSDVCTACSGPRLHPIGEGTERVEEEARRLFPQAAILRLDGETLRRSHQARVLWRRVAQREWDVLIGTQVLLRPLVERSAGMVGIVHADSGLSIPDFRAAERTYHQLLDTVGLARPAAAGGKVIVQTYLPAHHAVQAVVRRDESIFLSEEQSQRTALGYPPEVHLIALHISGRDEGTVKKASASWVKRLTAIADTSHGFAVLGPAPSPIPRLRGRHRWQILLKSVERTVGIEAARATLREMERSLRHRAVKFDVDVDPIDLW